MKTESRWESNLERARRQVENMTPQDKLSIGLSNRGQELFLKTLDEARPVVRRRSE